MKFDINSLSFEELILNGREEKKKRDVYKNSKDEQGQVVVRAQ